MRPRTVTPPVPSYHSETVTYRLSTIALRPQARHRALAVSAILAAMTKVRRAVGEHGERLAERHLADQGLVVLSRNWRCAEGEIDLVLRDGSDVVFCEVKTRRSTLFGTPAEAIRPDKIRRLRRLANRWLAEASVRPREVRFDVVEVLLRPPDPVVVEHTRAAF
jgi:putative endonuclease